MSQARTSIGTKGRAAELARAAAIGGLLLAALSPLACSSEDAGCDGVTDSQGRCETACKPELCPVQGSTCFDNACAAPCPNGDNVNECALGSRCEMLLLSDGTQGPYCAIYPFAKDGKIGQAGEKCTSNDQCDVKRGWECVGGVCTNNNKRFEPCAATSECDEAAGYQCVDQECRPTGCMTHEDCAIVGECQPGTTDTGQKVLACVKTNAQPPGQFHTACPLVTAGKTCSGDGDCDAATEICGKDADGKGRCAKKCTAEDKALCAKSESCLADSEGRTVCTECDFANGFVCIGAGPGDIDAYCTKPGCQADADCGTGFFCATVRTGRVPCQTACGIPGAPANQTCVPPEKIGPGKEYTCGPVSMLRNLCMKREFCNECTTDADCLGNPNQICSADSGGRKICTEVCDPNTNSCPWGNAATCGDWDNDGVFTCSHKFPAGCVGTGKGCEPCLDDADCPGGLCIQSDFTLERYCVDLAPSCSCAGLPTEQNVYCTGGGCPATPGGLQMHCYGGSQVQAADSPLYNKCVGANVNTNPISSPQTGCWPNN